MKTKRPKLKNALQLLLSQHKHLGVSEMLEHLSQKGHDFNKTSVYRALEKMLDEELVCRLQLAGDEATYELRKHHHAHVVCTNCSQTSTTACTYQHPEKVGSFVISHHHTTLFGLCKDCQ